MAIVEKYGSRAVDYRAEGITGTRIFMCLWGEIDAVKPSIGSPYPGIVGLNAANVHAEPWPGTKSTPTGPEYAKLIVSYSTSPAAEAQEIGYIEESLEFGGEMLTRDGGRWKVCKQDVKKDDIGGTWYPRLEYVRTVTVESISEWVNRILGATGKVNTDTFMGGEPGTWLFQGASAVKIVDEKGVAKWKITFKLVYRPTGFNKVWHGECQKGAKFEEVKFLPSDYEVTPGTTPPADDYTDKLYEGTSFGALLSGSQGSRFSDESP